MNKEINNHDVSKSVKDDLKEVYLYQVSDACPEDSNNYLNEFVVASSETEAEDKVISMYGGGLSRDSISALQIEVDGYDITLTPTKK